MFVLLLLFVFFASLLVDLVMCLLSIHDFETEKVHWNGEDMKEYAEKFCCHTEKIEIMYPISPWLEKLARSDVEREKRHEKQK